MAVTSEAGVDRSKLKIAIVVSKFNASITKELLSGAQDVLLDAGVAETSIDVHWVPGAFEISQVVKAIAEGNQVDGILPLGCVIRGETPHFQYVCDAVTSSLARLAIQSDVPIVFGILTTDDMAQAMARAGGQSHKGVEAARALLELIDTLSQVKRISKSSQ